MSVGAHWLAQGLFTFLCKHILIGSADAPVTITVAVAVAYIAVAMSSLRDLELLPDSSTQASWPDVKQALDNWAVASKFTYRMAKKSPDKGRYTCRVASYPWVVNVSRDTDGMLEMRVTHR
jgi:hypothetical protein